MLEAYEAYGDYDTMAELTRALVLDAAAAAGQPVALAPDGAEIDLIGQWRSVTVHDAGLRRGRRADHVGHGSTRICAGYAERARVSLRPELDGRRDRARAVREAGRAHADAADVRPGLPGRRPPAGPAAPRRSAPGRGLGPGHRRGRDRAGLLGAGRSGRAAPPAGRAVAGRGRRRSRGDAARRGLPARARIRHAADRRNGTGRRPAGHVAHRARHSRDDSVSDCSSRCESWRFARPANSPNVT